MKKDHIYLLIISILLIILFTCNGKKNPGIFEKNKIENKLKTLNKELSVLKRSNDSLNVYYSNSKNIKDSVVIRLKNNYINVYDTVNCLPEVYVDTLILTYENVINAADTLIATKDSIIFNLEKQNLLKDTLIIKEKKEVKKQKINKWKFGGVGFVFGYLTGKIL